MRTGVARRGLLAVVMALLGLAGWAEGEARTEGPGPGFTLRQDAGRWWLFTPDNHPFFSRGLCVLSRGVARAEDDPANPAYGAWRTYPSDQAWADASLVRLKTWGFTTIGAWSEHDTLRRSSHMLTGFAPVLHLGATAGAPWWDMWDERIVARMDAVAREQILAVRDDPRLIGYFTDNELGWWNAALFHQALEQPATSGQRRRLLQLLRQAYADDWERLKADFDPEFADSFPALEQHGQLWLRGGSRGIAVMRQFLAVVADRYYQLARDIVRRYDQRALVLGDRYQSFFYPEVARAAAPYVDAISSNLNAPWSDGTFPQGYLEALHSLTGRPVWVSEFYLAANQNRSGNRNTHGAFPVVVTQAERARAAVRTLTRLARLPYVVGADWFQYHDEPRHGRDDGENFNFGLVDILDRPYEELTRAFAGLDLQTLARRPAKTVLTAVDGVPRAPRDPFRDRGSAHAMEHWDRELGFVPVTSGVPLADLYVCWNSRALYVGVHALDVVEDAYYRNKSVPRQDRALWMVQMGGTPPIQARIGAGREAMCADPSVQIEGVSGTNLNVRNIALMEIPASRLGKRRLRPGDAVEFQAMLWTHARAYRVDWRARLTLKR